MSLKRPVPNLIIPAILCQRAESSLTFKNNMKSPLGRAAANHKIVQIIPCPTDSVKGACPRADGYVTVKNNY
jgi:hypothetical protein